MNLRTFVKIIFSISLICIVLFILLGMGFVWSERWHNEILCRIWLSILLILIASVLTLGSISWFIDITGRGPAAPPAGKPGPPDNHGSSS